MNYGPAELNHWSCQIALWKQRIDMYNLDLKHHLSKISFSTVKLN
jgi:hypothetical protein